MIDMIGSCQQNAWAKVCMVFHIVGSLVYRISVQAGHDGDSRTQTDFLYFLYFL